MCAPLQMVALLYDWLDMHAAYHVVFRSPFLAGMVDWLVRMRRVRGLLTACLAAKREREALDVARLYLRKWAPESVPTLFAPSAPADAAVQAVLAQCL